MSIFIIAEIGINHNGSVDTCKALIDVAKESGCDAVKLQKRDIDQVYEKEFLNQPRESPWGTTQRHQKEGLEFTFDDYVEINDYCKSKGIEWFASAWDINSQRFLKKFNLRFNKIASAMIVSNDLLEEVAKEGKHTFISTGMSTMQDIKKAVDLFRNRNCSFELMHAVSTYPMRAEDANLNVITTLKNTFNCNVGYSDHESGLAVSYAASALNISSLEKHITLDRSMYGSDQSASIEPAGLKQLVGGIRKIEKAMGDGKKIIINDEIPISKKLRAHITN